MIDYARRTTRPNHTPAPIDYRRPDQHARAAAARVAHTDACKAWAKRVAAAVGAAKGRPAPGTPPRIVLQAGDTVTLTAHGARRNRKY